MLPSLNGITRSTLRQPIEFNAIGNAFNRAIVSQYARALQQFGNQSTSFVRTPVLHGAQQRGVVSQSIMQQLEALPASVAACKSFRFNRPQMAQTDIRKLQRAVIEKLAPATAIRPILTTRHDPTVADIEALITEHGPVSLSLLGMLPAHEGGSSVLRRHTALVLHTLRDEHGTCFAIVVDGNPLARNPVKDAAEALAQRMGKQLHELDQHDLISVERELATSGDSMNIGTAIHDVINLDRAFEAHHATATSYANFVKRLHNDLKSEGLLDDYADFASIYAPSVTYAEDAHYNGALPDETARALLAHIKQYPHEVKPFVPLQSPVAQSDLFEQIPAVRDVFNAPSIAARWSPPTSTEELKNTLRQEATFAAAIDAPENQAHLEKLFATIAKIDLPPNHRGVSLQLQFPVTYGHVAHIAPINLWREKNADGSPGKLQMGCLHQEATPISGKVWEGEVHPTFDTAEVHPSGIAPIAESIKFTGLPNVVTILPCKYPDKIVPLTRAMAGRDNGYPYGGTPRWHGDKGRFPQHRPFNSCSNTSYEAHMICNGKYPTYQSTLPELWTGKIGELYGVDQSKIQTCTIGKTQYQIKDMLDLPFEIVGAMWPKVTIHSASVPSAVMCTFAPEHPAPLPLQVGVNLRLPDSAFPARFHAARFINPVKDMRLVDGTPIKNGITYSAEALKQGIIYSNDKAGKKLDFWLSGVQTPKVYDASIDDLTDDKQGVT